MRCDGMGCDGRQGRLTSAERGIISGFRVPVEVVGGCVAGDARHGVVDRAIIVHYRVIVD